MLLFISILLCTACNAEHRVRSANFTCFLNHFSPEQAAVFEIGVEEFNHFLEVNYPNESGVANKTAAYLKDLEAHNLYKPSWKFDIMVSSKIMNDYESSGLRKSIYIRGDEGEGFLDLMPLSDEEPILIVGVTASEQARLDSLNVQEHRNALYFNKSGSFDEAIASCSVFWPMLSSYYEMRQVELNMSPSVIIRGLETSFDSNDYEHPVFQSLVFVELFSWQMRKVLERAK